jgi:hypothetical protein
MIRNELDITALSPHLFLDVDVNKMDILKNKQMIVQRVLELGLLSDWILIEKYFGIAEIAMNLKETDSKSLAFISALANKPKEQFRCFITKQSIPQHWNF